MDYRYVAYNAGGELVKGKLSAASEEAATELLDYAGYQAVSIKLFVPFFNMDKFTEGLFPVKPNEIMLLYRQLAMLLESGINITASLELLQDQAENRTLQKILTEVISELRGGSQLSKSLSKYPKIFPSVYCQLIGVGEQTGDLETVLRQVADYMEKEATTTKETKGALMMPAITGVIAFIVIALMVVFILPSFTGMYASLGVELPPIAQMMVTVGEMAKSYGMYFFLGIGVIAFAGFLYTKTENGSYQRDKLTLRIPKLGRVKHLAELAHCCRSMSLLFRSGLPLTEVMPLVVKSSRNKVVAQALTAVHEDMVKGEGLHQPMTKNKVFLSMMVQMIRVGEETGNLDVTLLTVAQSYETEAEEKLRTVIALIQPTMTLVIGGVVGLIAVTLMSAMTAMYGEGF